LWGCTLNAQQPPYIVVTSDIPIEMQAQILTETAVAVHAILPVSTPMATLAPSPTPINVMEVLQRADTLRINGRYEEALEYYEQLISASESLEVRSQALFRFGQTAVREGLFNEALSVLNPLIDEQMGRSSQAYFLRAEAHLGLGEWQRAITDFELYLQLRPTVVDSYVYERIGDAYLALNQLEVAMQSYERAINSPRGVVPHFALREKVAQLYTNQGKIEQAVSQYDAILASAQNTGYRASIERRVAENLLQANLLELALQRFVRVFSEYTTTPDAYQAMQVLEANGQTLNALQKGKVAFNYGDYLLAIQSFNAYSTQVTLAEVPSEMHLLLGRAYREIGNPFSGDGCVSNYHRPIPTR
jgi:lipopolysaccharide biosynthesis regulator YciM